MTTAQIDKYARLLATYSLSLQAGQRVLIETTTLAEPLVRALYREVLRLGAIPFCNFSIEGQAEIWNEFAHTEAQWASINPLYALAVREFDAYLYIRAPYPSAPNAARPAAELVKAAQAALAPHKDVYNQRTATRALKRSLCEFPNQVNADFAGMTLQQYSDFIEHACFLHEEQPEEHWRAISRMQQRIVNYLNSRSEMRYVNERSDLRFSVRSRKWMNSDGQTNMPSGEVFSSPVEDSVEGHIHFDLPSVFKGQRVRGITLYVREGEVYKWEAEEGKDLLDAVFATDAGARRFGEVAIGCNYNIQQPVGNILFDEKIGGTVHLAVGDTYLQTGGKNRSAIHWDMIASMQKGGEIYADGKKIYENGQFVI